MDNSDQGGTNAPSQEYDAVTGLQNVDEGLFAPEDEGQAEETPEQTGESETSPEQPTGTETTPNLEGESQDEGSESDKDDEKPTDGDESPKDNILLAGTFKSEEDLRAAFANLGGEPENYSDVSQLEEAYKVRRSEWTRARQEYNEALQQGQIRGEAQTVQNLDEDALVDEAVKGIDWANVTDAQSAVRASIAATLAAVKKAMPQQQPVDENAIISRLGHVQKAQAGLAKLESDVPRLKTDPDFRNNFAAFIEGQKKLGTYTGDPGTSFRQFVSFGRAASQVQKQTQAKTKQNKLASTVPDAGTGTATQEQPKHDEVDDIMSAYQQKKNIFG